MRSVPEWVGKNDDQKIPDEVKIRVIKRSNGNCCECGFAVRRVMDRAMDHRTPLWNGGEHRESNLQLVHVWCHKEKTRGEATERAISNRKRRTHLLGPKKPKRKIPYRKFDGTPVFK